MSEVEQTLSIIKPDAVERDLVEEIPQERMVICRLDNWSADKLEAIWDAEINFCWLTYPESSRNLNRLLSTLDELS